MHKPRPPPANTNTKGQRCAQLGAALPPGVATLPWPLPFASGCVFPPAFAPPQQPGHPVLSTRDVCGWHGAQGRYRGHGRRPIQGGGRLSAFRIDLPHSRLRPGAAVPPRSPPALQVIFPHGRRQHAVQGLLSAEEAGLVCDVLASEDGCCVFASAVHPRSTSSWVLHIGVGAAIEPSGAPPCCSQGRP